MSLPPLPPGAVLDEDEAELPPLPPGAKLDVVDPHVTTPRRNTTDDEATKDAYTKEAALENVLTFFGNGGPTAAMRGAMAVGDPRQFRKGESAGDTYRRVRDDTERTMGLAERHGPQAEVAGVKFNPVALAGAAAPSLVAPNPTTLVGRLILSGILGGEQGARQSDADLTRGEFAPFLKDTGKGVGFGLAAGGVAEGVTAPMRAISRKGASLIGDEVATRAASDVADVGDEVRSLQGKARSETQIGSRLSENTLRAANAGTAPLGQSTLGPATQGRAINTLADSDFKALMESVANNSMDQIPDQVKAIAAAKAAAAKAAAGADTESARRTADYFAQSTMKTEVNPRLGRLAANTALGTTTGAVTGTLGAMGAMATGGSPTTALWSGIASGAAGALAGGSGLKRMVKRASESPRLRVSAIESLIRASQASQKAGQVGARSTAAVEPKLEQDQEEAIQAFVTGN